MSGARNPLPMGRSYSARPRIERSPFGFEDPELQRDSPERAESAPWPGSNFKVGDVMPGSTYLWACNELIPGGETTSVSRAQAAAAWIILLAVCYAGLWHVSGNQPPAYEDQLSSENGSDGEPYADYSILAIAGAMYLIISIASVDVWYACALIQEIRGPDEVLFTQRRMFGVFLLTTFCILVGASIRVIFYSAHEDVHLVLGAAAVLFIADVDEKAAAVLNRVEGEWALFWVLEVIGLSVGLALLAVTFTGNTDAVDNKDGFQDCNIFLAEDSCSIFSWSFVLTQPPVAVTACSFLLTSIISRPTFSFAAQTLLPWSLNGCVVTTLMLYWVAQRSLWLVIPEISIVFDFVAGGVALLFIVRFYRRELTCAKWMQLLRKGASRKGCRLLRFGGVIISLTFVMNVAIVAFSEEPQIHALELARYFGPVLFGHAIVYFCVHVWLLNGLRMPNRHTADLGHNEPLATVLGPFLLGWGLSEGALAIQYLFNLYVWEKIISWLPGSYPCLVLVDQVSVLMWYLVVGTVLIGGTIRTRAVAYWIATTIIRNVVTGCATAWVKAGIDKTVK